MENNEDPILTDVFDTKHYIPVKGYKDLVRDSRSGAIININSSAHLKAVKLKQENLAKKREYENLKNDVSEIKEMLSQLLTKVNGTKDGSN